MKTSNPLHTTIRNLRGTSHYELLLLSIFLIGWIGSWSRAVKSGNAHYKAGEYDAALEAYQSAATDRPEDAISHYNLGTALYQKKQFEKAADEFRRSLDAEDPIHRAQGYYNLGNAQIELNDVEGAIRSYKSALRLNPTDPDAKHNLELALEKLEQQQSQQNQSESGDEDSDQEEQEGQQQDQQNEEGQEQSQQNQDQQNKNEPNQQNQENQAESEQQQQAQHNQESSEQETASEESPSQPEQDSTQQPVGMSKEDAVRLLEAVKDAEKEIQKKILRKRFSRRQRPEKDW